MIPLRATHSPRSAPVMTYALIALNAGVFAYTSWITDEQAAHLIEVFGWTPFRVLDPSNPNPAVWLTLLTSLFVHGSWFHLLSNLWCLYMFGDVVEDRLGKVRFLLFYVLVGLGAAAAQMIVEPSGEVPMIGASGAIAGMLAAYWKAFPNGKLLAAIPLGFVFVREVPAVYYIFLWFALQLLAGFFQWMGPGEGPIVFFAQIGGFVTGLTLIPWFRPARNATGGFRRSEFY